MLVLLRRDFKHESPAGGNYFARDPAGTEIPEEYRNRLPRDAKILDEGVEMTANEKKAAKKAEDAKKPQQQITRGELAPKTTAVKGVVPPT